MWLTGRLTVMVKVKVLQMSVSLIFIEVGVFFNPEGEVTIEVKVKRSQAFVECQKPLTISYCMLVNMSSLALAI